VGTLLHHEHELLGATFSADAQGVLAPDFYGSAQGEPEAFDTSCALCDVSSVRSLLVTGASAGQFVSVTLSCKELALGDLRFALVLAGDGMVVACVLVGRTGDSEYVIWCPPERVDALTDWLDDMADIDQDGFRPFADLSIADVTGRLQSLLLAGPDADRVLGDYLAPGVRLPRQGAICNIDLDDITCLVGRIRCGHDALTLLLVPPARTVALWRSLLSFDRVVPVGLSALWGRVETTQPGAVDLVDEPELRCDPTSLGLSGLLRRDATFVGARALGL
jgi:aminomethyltransferase